MVEASSPTVVDLKRIGVIHQDLKINTQEYALLREIEVFEGRRAIAFLNNLIEIRILRNQLKYDSKERYTELIEKLDEWLAAH